MEGRKGRNEEKRAVFFKGNDRYCSVLFYSKLFCFVVFMELGFILIMGIDEVVVIIIIKKRNKDGQS